jgi:ketosteroid isomerase-like protein
VGQLVGDAGRLAAGRVTAHDVMAARLPGRTPEMSGQAKAMQPEDVTRLVAERLNAGDAAGVAALYEPHAVLAYPADRPVTGREAIQAIYQQMADAGVKFALETPLPTVRFEDLALTSTRSADNTGVRVQVLRRQPDGSWLRIIDRPEVPQP